MTKPFALLTTRPEAHVVEDEYEQFLHALGMSESQLHLIRADQRSIAEWRWQDYSAILLGGSPYNTSDPRTAKSTTQLRVEAELAALLDALVAADHPFFGACYGVGTLGKHQGGVIDRTYGEPSGAKHITLTAAGKRDPLLSSIPETFVAFAGHNEALRGVPNGAVLLAGSAACPVHMFRVKTNLYAT